MSLITQFEADCKAAGVRPTDALKAAGLHTSLWWKWKAGKVSPTLESFEKAVNGLSQLRFSHPRGHAHTGAAA